MTNSASEYIDLIDDCEARESRLTDWERSFLDSIRRQLEGGKAMSYKQGELLDDIWERATARG